MTSVNAYDILMNPDPLWEEEKQYLRNNLATTEEIDYFKLVRDKWRALNQSEFKTNSIDCILACKAVKGLCIHNNVSAKEYYNLNLGQRHRYEYAHRAAYMMATKTLIPKSSEVSHLCHHGNCVNPEHLILESAEMNRSRNKCIGWTWIPCPHCNGRFNPCPHNPKCILPQD